MPRFWESYGIRRAILLTAIGCSSFLAYGQTVQIKILFLNGNTGAALKNARVVVYDNSDPTHPKYLHTNANGIVQTTAERGSLLRAFVEKGFIRSCQDGGFAALRRFDVGRIVSYGIVEKSKYKAQPPSAQPGMLVRIVRRSSFWEALRED